MESKFAQITIELSNFQGFEYIEDDDEVTYKVVASHLVEKAGTTIYHGETQAGVKNLQLLFSISIDTSDSDEIFRLFSSPVFLMLVRHAEDGRSEEIAHSSIDLQPLFTTHGKERTIMLKFTALSPTQSIRKITFDAKISSDCGLLEAPLENFLLITIDSLHNFNVTEKDSMVKIGLKVPFEDQDKDLSITFDAMALDDPCCGSRLKKWCHQSRFCHSSYSNEPYLYSVQEFTSCSKLHINTVMRSMFARDALYETIRESGKITIELEWCGRHLSGIIKCEELLHLDVKRIRRAVPLSDVDKTSSDENGHPIILVVEVEFNRPLNEEICEEDHLAEDDENSTYQIHTLVTDFKRDLLATSKRLLEKHRGTGGGKDFANILLASGDFSQIEDTLASSILAIERKFGSPRVNLKNHLIAHVLNSAKQADDTKLFASHIYSLLNYCDEAETLLLSAIVNDRRSERSWIDYVIFHARLENFDNMAVGLDEVLKINENSQLGSIFLAYKLFKLQKTPECLNLIRLSRSTHGASEELSIIEHLIDHQLGNENLWRKGSTIANNVANGGQERNEIIWIPRRNANLLNRKNPFIRCAVFFIEIGCFEFAELCLAEYYAVRGVNINYLYLLAAIDSSRGDYSNALIHLNKIAKDDLASNQINYPQIVEVIVLNLLLANAVEKAKALYDTYGPREYDNFLITYLFGMHYKSSRDYETAKGFLTQSVNLFPGHFAMHALGECCAELKLFYDAEGWFMRARALASETCDQ